MSNRERKVGKGEEERGEGDGDNLKQERFRSQLFQGFVPSLLRASLLRS